MTDDDLRMIEGWLAEQATAAKRPPMDVLNAIQRLTMDRRVVLSEDEFVAIEWIKTVAIPDYLVDRDDREPGMRRHIRLRADRALAVLDRLLADARGDGDAP